MRAKDISVIIGFAVLLCIPLAHCLYVNFRKDHEGYGDFPELSHERTLSASSVKGFVLGLHRDIKKNRQAFTDYFEDNFTWRKHQFKAYSFIHKDVFNENPLPKEVIEGNDGWMFLGERYSNAVTESKGISVFSEAELESIEQKIALRQKWLEEQGISSYVAFAPNKHTVYGEHLRIKKSDSPTNMELLIDRFSNSEVNVLDLSASFSNHPQQQLYLKSDSHWNDHGAYYAYQALMQRIKEDHPEVDILQLENMRAVVDTAYRLEMARVLNKDIEEVFQRLEKNDSTAVLQPSMLPVPEAYYRNPEWYEYRYTSNANDLKVLIFRDSFSKAMKKYLIESFGETVMIWHPEFDKDLIEQEDPDIVIYQIVERNLDFFLKYE